MKYASILILLALSTAVRAELLDAFRAAPGTAIRAYLGEAESQNTLGRMYFRGAGVPQNDVEAVAWWQRAADQGDANAEANLGAMYDQGRGVVEDDEAAMMSWRKAARQGNAAAQVNINAMIARGRGIPEDDVEAVAWYRAAAETGDTFAQLMIGRRYQIGRGVAADKVESYFWYNIAAAGGNPIAAARLPEAAAALTADQIAAALHKTHRWVAEHPARTPAAKFSVVEATIPEMQAAMRDGRLTSRELVTQYLVRIGLYENRINAVLSVNTAALAEAEALDAERAAGKVRGLLHGIPIALKDNIHADGMPTTAGALAFADLRAPYEATLTKNLRDAGAIIIAKTVLTELANWMSPAAPNNYSAVGGFSFNPYDPRPDPRPAGDGRGAMPTGSSSSGAGTAANFWAASVGTETSVSVIGPASFNMLVGISPTLGRVSRYGVVPITADQDRPGPHARTVTDAAILLGALEGAAPDANDPETKRCAPPPGRDYTAYLKADGLKGARLGVPRAWFVEPYQLPGRTMPEGGGPPDQTAMLNEAIAVLKAQGAIIVDPADIPTVTTQDHTRNIVTWERCFGPDGFRGKDDHCAYTIKYGMKRDFNAWLASLGTAAPVETLTELRQWNKIHEAAGSMKYGQGQIDLADEPDLVADKARYDTDRARDLRLVGPEGFDAVAKEHKLNAFVLIGSRGVNLLSKPGYPVVTVPFGLVANGGNWPAGWESMPMPMGITFAGTACTDPRLIEIAYSFEQATKRRRPPDL